jgi:hypothetical protein
VEHIASISRAEQAKQDIRVTAGGKHLVNAQNNQNIVSIILHFSLFHLNVKCSKVNQVFTEKWLAPQAKSQHGGMAVDELS